MIRRAASTWSRRGSNRSAASRRSPSRTTRIGASSAGAVSIIRVAIAGISSSPKKTSRLSLKWRKNVRRVTPARATMSGTVVAWKPRSAKSSIAAVRSRSRVSGAHLAMGTP
jgi:hypothetical protein